LLDNFSYCISLNDYNTKVRKKIGITKLSMLTNC